MHVGSLEQLTAYFVKGSFEAFGPFVWYERECGGCVLSVRSIEANRQLELELSNDVLTYGEQRGDHLRLLDPHMVPDRIRHIVNFARQRF